MASLAELRADAEEIFTAGLRSVDPFEAVLKHLVLTGSCLRVGERVYDLSDIGKLCIVGFGKAGAPMALAMEQLLSDRIASGLVIVKYGYSRPLQRIKIVEAGHPVPDQAGLNAAQQIAGIVRTCGETDLLFVLISGGGSALLPCPVEGVQLRDKQKITELLLKSGATIQEVNAVRKHISRLKGGRLAELASPARVIALILSDVVGDSLDSVASGPTVPDSTTFADCLVIVQRYELEGQVPPAILDHLERGARDEIAETPKNGAIFDRVQNVLVGSNRLALEAAQRCAQTLGYETRIALQPVSGESRMAAQTHAALVRELRQKQQPQSPVCFISGGETTVTVRGAGQGGRNQEFALAAAIEIDGLDDVVILSAGTDGNDGPTDAAGAIVDGSTLARGRAMNLNAAQFLDRNDSYHFLQATQDLLITGPTFTNVMDIQIMLVG